MQHLEDYRNHFSEMISYVDSGFAFVGVLSKYAHAVAVVGYNINKSLLADAANRKEKIEDYIEEVSIKITEDGQIITERECDSKVKVRIVSHICYSLEVPKYLWCFEISSRESYVSNKVESVVLIDSTASANDSEPFLYIMDTMNCYYSDGSSMQRVILSVAAVPFPCFKGGVERIRSHG